MINLSKNNCRDNKQFKTLRLLNFLFGYDIQLHKNVIAFLQHENEISNAAESQRIPITYGNTDDEDLAGSGEIEGSAGEVDYHPNVSHRNTDGKARKCLIFHKI